MIHINFSFHSSEHFIINRNYMMHTIHKNYMIHIINRNYMIHTSSLTAYVLALANEYEVILLILPTREHKHNVIVLILKQLDNI